MSVYGGWSLIREVVEGRFYCIRICGDIKVSVNPVIISNPYPLPNGEDLFATLAGGKIFSKLDLSNAYQRLELTEESQTYLTINTHKGVYNAYQRLTFGIATAPSIYQEVTDQLRFIHIDHLLQVHSVADPVRHAEGVEPTHDESTVSQDAAREQKIVSPEKSSQSCVSPEKSSQSCVSPEKSSQSCVSPEKSSQSCVSSEKSSQLCVSPEKSSQPSMSSEKSPLSCVSEKS